MEFVPESLQWDQPRISLWKYLQRKPEPITSAHDTIYDF